MKVEIESEYINILVRRNAIDIEFAEMSRIRYSDNILKLESECSSENSQNCNDTMIISSGTVYIHFF